MANHVHGEKDLGLDPTRTLQRKLYRAAKQNENRRFHALFDKVARRDVLRRAWIEVARKGGAPGVDAETIEAIEAVGVEEFLDQLQRELNDDRYQPQAVRRVTIPKRSGGERHLGVPAIRDRVVQAAVKLVIEPIFEADFVDCSYGFRPKRSAHQACERVRSGLRCGRRWVVDADITGFFDNLDHGLLLRMVRRRISDRRLLHLLQQWLKAGILTDRGVLHPTAGTPQGGVISPLLANIYLHWLDRVWQRRCWQLGELTRYADDLVVMCGSEERAAEALIQLQEILSRLKLTLSARKTRVVGCGGGAAGFDFLGYHFRYRQTRQHRANHFYAACWPSRLALVAARERIRELTPVSRIGRPIIVVVHDLNRFLRGWGAYFRHGNATKQFKHLDRYVFERLARFIARKHHSRNWQRGMVDLLESHTQLGLHRLAGTVRYASAHAAR